MSLKPPYKAPNNTWYTRALFLEIAQLQKKDDRPIQPVFTLRHDKEGLINGRKTFVELGDPTGYKWAMKYLGDWDHWLVLEQSTWFQEALAEWRRELDSKIASEAMDRIREIAADPDDKGALAAAKWLASKPWVEKKTSRGRPTKEEVQGELKRQAQATSVEDEDAARIQLKVVK